MDKYISRALRNKEKTHSQNEQVIQNRKDEVYTKIPHIREIDKAMQAFIAKIALLSFDKSFDLTSSIADVKQNHNNLIQKKGEYLKKGGYPINYLDAIYECDICSDVGYDGLELCSCILKKAKMYKEQDEQTVLSNDNQTFENFNTGLYSKIPDARYKISPFDNISKILEITKNYAQNFSSGSDNLIFTGLPGLSKTYLSNCIRTEVSQKGFSVVFDTAINILDIFEKTKFQDIKYQEQVDKILSCDLLIIDDLGTEMVTSFTVSALYNLINIRLLKSKPMILNTNVTVTELSKKYTPAIASRLEGEFKHLRFFGDDIRKILKNM